MASAATHADTIYVSSYVNDTIEKFTPGGVGSVFATTGSSGPSGLALDSAGNLYVGNDGVYNGGISGTVAKITPGILNFVVNDKVAMGLHASSPPVNARLCPALIPCRAQTNGYGADTRL